MNRENYHWTRRQIHRVEMETRLLASPNAYEENARQAARYATEGARSIARLRAEIAAPTDAIEAARALRWDRLHAALFVASNATRLRDRARRMVWVQP